MVKQLNRLFCIHSSANTCRVTLPDQNIEADGPLKVITTSIKSGSMIPHFSRVAPLAQNLAGNFWRQWYRAMTCFEYIFQAIDFRNWSMFRESQPEYEFTASVTTNSFILLTCRMINNDESK